MTTTHNQPSATTCVEKYLGSSYDTVKKVADNLTALLALENVAEASGVLTEVQDTLLVVENTLDIVTDTLSTRQELLVAGVNMKTVDGQSLLGPGNIITQSEAAQVTNIHLTDVEDSVEQLILMGV